MDVVQALQHSCDIFFYETAQKLGINKISEMARRFGMGEKINIGLENEKPGLLPPNAEAIQNKIIISYRFRSRNAIDKKKMLSVFRTE